MFYMLKPVHYLVKVHGKKFNCVVVWYTLFIDFDLYVFWSFPSSEDYAL